jgi:uncharacterized protein YdeI (YjbR/CyaY-like superfamily)
MKPEAPIKLFDTAAELRSWLEKHYDQQEGMWLKIAKKNNPKPSVTYAEAIEEALCFGWIDGQLKSLDAGYYLQRFTPRRPKSIWSKINVERAEQLIQGGRMMPPGQTQIDVAKNDGRWDKAYEGSAKAEIPADFLAALKKNQKAWAFYKTLNRANIYAIYFKVHHTKTPQARTQKIGQIIAQLAESKKFH